MRQQLIILYLISPLPPSIEKAERGKPSASEPPPRRELSTPPPRRRRSSAARPRRSVCSKRFETPRLGIAISAAPLAWSVLCIGLE